ncbi:CatB-related O-acetyltransferase [Paracoccus litorisediminis]|uniref:CatB-related O-acetyltransferase n=1 Tax=Paracoccus litorisediminis TaxID=2006130 RepID=UPI00372FBADC
MEYRNFNDLKAAGLRVYRGLDTRNNTVNIGYEAPVQLSNSDMFVYQDVRIGMYSYLRTGTVRYVRSIGRYCSIGPGVTLGEGEHPTNWLGTTPTQYTLNAFSWYEPQMERVKSRRIKRTPDNSDDAKGDIEIGNDVWIGGGSTVRRGIRIGDGAIIAGNAFVTRDVLPYEIVGGLPARHLRFRFSDEVIARLLELQWWRFDINDLAGVPFNDIEAAIVEIERRERMGEIKPREAEFRSVKLHSKGWHSPSWEAPAIAAE